MIVIALLLAGCIHLDCRPTGRLIVEPVRLAGSTRVDGVMGGVDCQVNVR